VLQNSNSPSSDLSSHSDLIREPVDRTKLSQGTSSATSPQLLQPLFESKDLALLHHWTLETSKSIISTHELDQIWRRVFPEIGFRYTYVMYSIFSLTSLHIAYLNPSDRHLHICDAARYHNKALSGFREDINYIGAENSNALFANAILSFFYAFLTFGNFYGTYNGETSSEVQTSQILGDEWIPLARGVEAVLGLIYDHVKTGPLSSLLSLGNWEMLDPVACSAPNDQELQKIKEIWTESENAKVYDEALDLLRKCNAWMTQFKGKEGETEETWGYNRAWSGPFIWLFLISNEYLLLQRQRQPAALIIFAYFGSLLQRLDEYWWMEGCGKSIVGAVQGCLGSFWNPWMQWPKDFVGLT
jgi:hypothetical protein